MLPVGLKRGTREPGYDLEARKVKVLSTIIEQYQPRLLVYIGERIPRAKGQSRGGEMNQCFIDGGKSCVVEKDLVNQIADHLNPR